METGTRTSPTVSLIGYWSAVLTAFFSLAFDLAVIVTMIASLATLSASAPQGWTGIEGFLATFQPVQMLSVIPSLFLAPAFTLIYATMATINYMVQLVPVWRSIVSNESDGLAMFVLGNPYSFFWALAYAYVFMNLAMWFAAPVFSGDGLEKWVRRLFILNGLSMVVTLSGIVVDSPPYYLIVALLVWCPIFTAAAIALAILFRRNLNTRGRIKPATS